MSDHGAGAFFAEVGRRARNGEVTATDVVAALLTVTGVTADRVTPEVRATATSQVARLAAPLRRRGIRIVGLRMPDVVQDLQNEGEAAGSRLYMAYFRSVSGHWACLPTYGRDEAEARYSALVCLRESVLNWDPPMGEDAQVSLAEAEGIEIVEMQEVEP